MHEALLGSFHAVNRHDQAANALNISQPVLTEQMKSLELRFRADLFNRSSSKVQLANEGASVIL